MATTSNKHRQILTRIIIISIVAAFAGILFGMDTGIISGALPLLSKEFSIGSQMQEYIVSAVLFGAVFGTIIAGTVAKKIGRKNILLISAIIFIIGSILCYIANSPLQLIIFRILVGTAVGMAAFGAPLYLAEMAPKKIRGGLIALYQTMINVGILSALAIDTYFTYTENWRAMLGFLGIPAIIMFLGIICLPKSPRWLILVKRKTQAREVLQQIRDPSTDDIEQEIREIEETTHVESKGWHLFRDNKYFRKVIYLGIGIQAAQQLTGINIMFYYAPKVFAIAGFTSEVARMWGGVSLGVTMLLFTAFSIPFVDKVGRKPLLYGGAIGMGIAFLALAFLFHIGTSSVWIQFTAVGCLIFFIMSFAFTSGPITWALCSEIYPLKGRGFGVASSTATNWITNLIIGATFLTLIDNFGAVNTFLLYGIINLALMLLYFFFTPETKGVSLEHLEKNLMSGVKLKYIGK